MAGFPCGSTAFLLVIVHMGHTNTNRHTDADAFS